LPQPIVERGERAAMLLKKYMSLDFKLESETT